MAQGKKLFTGNTCKSQESNPGDKNGNFHDTATPAVLRQLSSQAIRLYNVLLDVAALE